MLHIQPCIHGQVQQLIHQRAYRASLFKATFGELAFIAGIKYDVYREVALTFIKEWPYLRDGWLFLTYLGMDGLISEMNGFF